MEISSTFAKTANWYIQFYNQSPPPPNSLYFGEKMLQTAISPLAVPNQFPPNPNLIKNYWRLLGTFNPCREFGEQRTFNLLTFCIHLTFFYLSFATFIPCRELGEQRIALGLQPKKTLNLHFKTKLWKFKISESFIFILFVIFDKEKSGLQQDV